MPDPVLLAEARALHGELLVVNGIDASILNEEMLTSLGEGGVDVNVATIPDLSLVSNAHRFLWEHRDRLTLATSVEAIHAARRAGKVALVAAWQWVDLAGGLEELYGYHRLGLRSSGLVYNTGNAIGSGCLDPSPGGLSRYGVTVVRTLEALGIVVDVGGHLSEVTSLDVLAHATRPVICSHTNPRALRDIPRNTSDDLMRRVAEVGGVIGLTAFNHFLVAEGRATLDMYLDQLEYVVRLLGVDHVAIGLDQLVGRHDTGPVDPRVLPPQVYPQRYEDWIYVEGLEDFSGVPRITAGLLARGYTPEDIGKIMGGNWLRVWEEVWGV